MRKVLATILCIVMTLALFGCAGDDTDFDEPTIEVLKGGRIIKTTIETFDKPYYNVDELKEEYNEAIKEYNLSKAEDKVTLKDIHTLEDEVSVCLEYESAEDCMAFEGDEMFYGTVKDARLMGYMTEVSLKNVADGSIIDETGLLKISDNNVFITADSGLIKLPGKIMYLSAGAEAVSDKTVRISSDSSGFAVIVIK